MEKTTIIKHLTDMLTPDNELIIKELLDSIEKISEEDLNLRLEKLNINEENLEDYVNNLIEERKKSEEIHEKFINVNDMFSYGRIENTIHMHIIPKDLHDLKNELGDEKFYSFYKAQLEDFLLKLQSIFISDPTMEKLFAVSPIFFNQNISLAHESLGFDKVTEIDLNNENDTMSKGGKQFFLDMFNKNKYHVKKVYYTQMSREKLLGEKYLSLPEEYAHIKF